MGMLELSIWLFVIFTIGQYAVAWGSYFEKKLTLDEVKAMKMKKLQKQMKRKKQPNETEIEEEMEQQFVLMRPSFKNTLPFQIVRFIIALPAIYRWLKEYREMKRKEIEDKKEQERLEAEELERLKEEMEREKEMKKAYKRKRPVPLPSYDGEPDECILEAVDEPTSQQVGHDNNIKFCKSINLKCLKGEVKTTSRITRGLWTDEDLTELAKYMKKYPVGTTERWEKIAEALDRTVVEVTHFARKLKDNAFRYKDFEFSGL